MPVTPPRVTGIFHGPCHGTRRTSDRQPATKSLPHLPGNPIASVKVVEFADGFEVATAQAALGGSCRVSLVEVGLSISAMASTPM